MNILILSIINNQYIKIILINKINIIKISYIIKLKDILYWY